MPSSVRAQIQTQPFAFALAGDGLSVGRDGGSPVSPDYDPPFEFEGGEIERVVVDVSGDPYVDHELGGPVAWLAPPGGRNPPVGPGLVGGHMPPGGPRNGSPLSAQGR